MTIMELTEEQMEIIYKHANSMTHDQPEIFWWVIEHMESLAEDIIAHERK